MLLLQKRVLVEMYEECSVWNDGTRWCSGRICRVDGVFFETQED